MQQAVAFGDLVGVPTLNAAVCARGPSTMWLSTIGELAVLDTNAQANVAGGRSSLVVS